MTKFKGADRIAGIALGWDPIAKRSNGALIRRFAGDVSAKTGVLCTYKTGQAGTLTALTAYTPGTTNRTAWFTTMGVDMAQNDMITDLQSETPVDAVLFRGVELWTYNFLVATAVGSSPELCVITAAGTAIANVEVGMLAWGTPGEGSFTGVNAPTAVALGRDAHVISKKITGSDPYVTFLVH